MARSSRRRRDVRTWRRWVRELWTPILRARLSGVAAAVLGVVILAILATYHPSDPSFDAASPGPAANLLGPVGADIADIGFQTLGLGAWAIGA